MVKLSISQYFSVFLSLLHHIVSEEVGGDLNAINVDKMTSEFVRRYFTTTLLFGLVFTICVDIKPILAQEADEVLNVIPEVGFERDNVLLKAL